MRKSYLIATSFLLLLAVALTQPPRSMAQGDGPRKGVGETVIIPRKKTNAPPQPDADQAPEQAPPPVQPKKEKINPDEAYAIRTDVELVSVGVVVQDKNGNFIPGLKKDQFRVLEDGAPQTIRRVEATEA